VPYPNFHAARVVNPDKYDSFARQKIKSGIFIILGIKNNKSETQAYRFDKKLFTVEEAKKWLADHKIKYISFEPASDKKEIQSYQVNIQCLQLRHFTQDEIIKLIPKDTLDKIKLNDPHPFFTIYSIAHEGISNPKILNDPKSKPITWLKAAIQSIKNKVLTGIKFYKDHNEDNSTINRRELGEVITDLQQEIGGILHHLVIGYHPPNVVAEVKQNDVCSQEGLWDLIDQGATWLANKLDAITGIALGRHDEDIPAFAGAQRLGMVQAFDNIDKIPGRYKIMAISRDDLLTAKIDDIRWLVEQKEYHPNQLFKDEAAIKDDRVFSKIYREYETLAETLKKSDAEKIALNAQIEKEKQETLKVKSELEARIKTEKTIIRREQEQTAAERFEKLLTLQKATEVQKKYAKPRFKIDKMQDLSDEGLQIRMLEILEDYKADAAMGILKEDITQMPSGGNPASGGTGNSANVDYTDAKNNELLEGEE
jgi:hypothetical protein